MKPVTLGGICAALVLIGFWVAGYNFDERGAIAVQAFCAAVFAFGVGMLISDAPK